jgi:hypothetical protein
MLKGFDSMRGLVIQGLDSVGISGRLEKYVADYFKGFKLSAGASLFQESYILYFGEVQEVIPKKYHHLFTDKDKFNSYSGFLEGISMYDDSKPILMLLTNCDNTKAFFLFVRDSNMLHDTILADFLS